MLAFVIGISRVFVGKHFVGDVLTGFCVGLLFGWLCALPACLYNSRREMAKPPERAM